MNNNKKFLISFIFVIQVTGLLCLPGQVLALPVLSTEDLQELDSLCKRDNTPASGLGQNRKILVYDTAGAISPLHDSLPAALQADGFSDAGIVLCLTPHQEAIAHCDFGVFFRIPRIRHDFLLHGVSRFNPAPTRFDAVIEGSLPPACSDAGTVDASVTALEGTQPGAVELHRFLTARALNNSDSDSDALSGVEEFIIDSDPFDADSPGPLLTLYANGNSGDLQLFDGDSLSVAISVWPGPALGNPASYRVWAETSRGLFSYLHPSGFRPTATAEQSAAAPVIKLFNYPLLTLPSVTTGTYTLKFAVDEDSAAFSDHELTVKVSPDPCRETITLPYAADNTWTSSCTPVKSETDNDQSRYYSFFLDRQRRIDFRLESADQPGRLYLLTGSGRNGELLARGSPSTAGQDLVTELDAGHYTLEVAGAAPGRFRLSISDSALPWHFNDVTAAAGFDYRHGYTEPASGIGLDRSRMAPGVAAGDYDQDGWTDLYVVRGTVGPNLLFRNRGDGTFSEVGQHAGVALEGAVGSGAVFADYDGDGWPDLFVGGLNGSPSVLYHNEGDGSFTDVTAASGITGIVNSFSASFGDYDLDGDLDLYVSHWTANRQGKYLWRNNGDGSFTDVSARAGIPDDLMSDYSATFADIDNDSWPDLLIAADFGTSQVFRNNRDGTFSNITTAVIDDENGMGAAVGDYDNDGDLDWFVSSVFDPNGPPVIQFNVSWQDSGNRLYRNLGNGEFENVTDVAGVRNGYWGWGSCFADFNNDTLLDIYHVNGFTTTEMIFTAAFENDPARMFIAAGNGTFDERAEELGTASTAQGRGLVCFDYDRDGDVDLFISNLEQAPVLLRNDGGNDGNYLHLKVAGEDANSAAIGARIEVSAGGITQIRELSAGNNYLSQNPAEAYFGLGEAGIVDRIRVRWPSGREAEFSDVDVNQFLVIPAGN